MTTEIDRARGAQTSLDRRGGKPIDTAHASTFLDVRCIYGLFQKGRVLAQDGKGNPESFESCSHGAGRVMSRNEAKKRFTLDDHAAATAGVECRKDVGVLDETPGAYKDIDAVMEAQSCLGA